MGCSLHCWERYSLAELTSSIVLLEMFTSIFMGLVW